VPRKLTNNEFLLRLSERDDKGLIYDYSKVEYTTIRNKIIIVCPIHGEFKQSAMNHINNCGCYTCGRAQVSDIAEKKFTTEWYLEKIQKCREDRGEYYNYSDVIYSGKRMSIIIGCPVHGKFNQVAEDHRYNCGCPLCEKDKRKQTNLARHGVENPSQAESTKKKVKEKRIKNGFAPGGASKEATLFFKKYVLDRHYDIDQVAYHDKELNLFEWGYHIGKWISYDFVAFQKGHRGQKDFVIEIVEYHGPWHYTQEDVEARGHEKATPFAKNKVTIEESYKNDVDKFNFAKSLTDSVTIIWAKDL